MSRNEKKIRKALDAKGWEVLDLWWEPLGGHFEMCGQDGGWSVYADALPEFEGRRDDRVLGCRFIGGINIDIVLEAIEGLKNLREG